MSHLSHIPTADITVTKATKNEMRTMRRESPVPAKPLKQKNKNNIVLFRRKEISLYFTII